MEHFIPYDIKHVVDKYAPNYEGDGGDDLKELGSNDLGVFQAPSWLLERLGKANTQRRRLFKFMFYLRSHELSETRELYNIRGVSHDENVHHTPFETSEQNLGIKAESCSSDPSSRASTFFSGETLTSLATSLEMDANGGHKMRERTETPLDSFEDIGSEDISETIDISDFREPPDITDPSILPYPVELISAPAPDLNFSESKSLSISDAAELSFEDDDSEDEVHDREYGMRILRPKLPPGHDQTFTCPYCYRTIQIMGRFQWE